MEIFVRLTLFLSVLSLMLIWEWRRPFRNYNQSKPEHLVRNLGLMVLNSASTRILSAGGAFYVASLAQTYQLGLFHKTGLPDSIEILLSLLVLDLAIYLQHILFHKVPMFWRLHRVHHTDLAFDTSTGVRFHPVEILLSMYYKMLIVLCLGIEPFAVIIFEITLNACALFNHGNVTIPPSWERIVRSFVITPDMHRIHHSSDRRETDSNYGFSVSWWDRIFHTYCAEPKLGQSEMKIGVAQERQPENLGFLRLLQLPFEKAAAPDQAQR